MYRLGYVCDETLSSLVVVFYTLYSIALKVMALLPNNCVSFVGMIHIPELFEKLKFAHIYVLLTLRYFVR